MSHMRTTKRIPGKKKKTENFQSPIVDITTYTCSLFYCSFPPRDGTYASEKERKRESRENIKQEEREKKIKKGNRKPPPFPTKYARVLCIIELGKKRKEDQAPNTQDTPL